MNGRTGAEPSRSRARRWVALALVPTTFALVIVACSDDDGDTGTTTTGVVPSSDTTTPGTSEEGITEEEAVEIARRHHEAEDPDFDFDSTRPVVIADAESYDVSFPPASPTGPGGEPHVVVDQTTGEVIDSYLTR